MSRNPDGWLPARKWRQLKSNWAPYLDQKTSGADLAQQMGQASIPSLDFFFLFALAAAIATFGLVVNSAPEIIGAMIIAPLMAPIMSLSFGLVALDRGFIGRSIVTVTAGVISVLGLAYLIIRCSRTFPVVSSRTVTID